MSQDEARLPMAPTPGPTLAVKGHRPTVGTRDREDLLYVLAAVDVATGALHADTPESPARARAKAKAGKAEARRMRGAFASHLRHVARLDPAERHERVAPIIGDAPWHRGEPIDEALADCPRPGSYRLPNYSPQPNVIGRSRKLLRRRATRDRLFDTRAGPRRSLRAGLCYHQTMRGRVRSPLAGCYTRPAKRTGSPSV